MALLNETDWAYVTGEEDSYSVGATLAFGKLWFKNESTNEKLALKYRCLSAGQGKGYPLGASKSKQSDPSGALKHVGVVPGHSFSYASFPCRGSMFAVGASVGVMGKAKGMKRTTKTWTQILFGVNPVFAAIKVWGLANSALPSVGLSAGLAVFEVIDEEPEE